MANPTELDLTIEGAHQSDAARVHREWDESRRETQAVDRHEQLAAKLDSLISESVRTRQEIKASPTPHRLIWCIGFGILLGHVLTFFAIILLSLTGITVGSLLGAALSRNPEEREAKRLGVPVELLRTDR